MGEIVDFSAVAASNNAAVPNGAPEGWFPPQVNNTVRELMARDRRQQLDTNGSLTCGGGTTAYTLSVYRDTAAAAQGEEFTFKVNATNTGAVTLTITPGAAGVAGAGSARGAVAVQRGTLALVAGDWIIGDMVTVRHDGTQLQMVTPPRAVTGTGKMVRDTSPALVTPALGTPTSGTLTNCTIPASGITAGTIAAVVKNSAQPLVITSAGGGGNDLTGDGTVATIPGYGTEIKDQANELSGSTFTAAQTGAYDITVGLELDQLGALFIQGVVSFVVTGSANDYTAYFNPFSMYNATAGGGTLEFTRKMSLTVGDTITVTGAVAGSTKTVDFSNCFWHSHMVA